MTDAADVAAEPAEDVVAEAKDAVADAPEEDGAGDDGVGSWITWV